MTSARANREGARTRWWVAVTLLTTSLTACGPGEAEAGGEAGRTLDVLAASSLSETFETLADRFESEHPGTTVRLVLDSSTTLATQVAEGAPADVLATADERSMQLAVDAGAAEDPAVFASNELVLVTPAADPANVRSVADLDDPDVGYVACVETAPCGALAAQLLAAAGVGNPPRSFEVDVKAVLAKVVADEADAGLVYRTDALTAGPDVRALPVPGSADAVNRYQVAIVDQADDPPLAEDWIALVQSPEGQRILADAGFGSGDGG